MPTERPLLTKMFITTVFIVFAVVTPAFGQPVSRIINSNVMTGNPANQGHIGSSLLQQNGPHGQTSQSQTTPVACNDFESRIVFQDCVMPFGYAHSRFMQRMISQPTCPAQVFDCGRVDYLMRCINRLPGHRVSNQCWPLIPALLTNFFKLYRIPCTFDDIIKQCRSTSQDLLTVEKRSQQGLGIATSSQRSSGGLNPSPQQTNTVNDVPRQARPSNSSPPQQSRVSESNQPSVLETILHSPSLSRQSSPLEQGQGANSPSLQALLNSALQRSSGQNNLPEQSTDANGHLPSILNNQSSSTFNSRPQQVNSPQQPDSTQSLVGQQPSQSAAALNLRPYCSAAEMNLVFQRCARSYGYAHYRYFQYLARQPTCRVEVFDCGRTHQFIGCVNRLPVTQITNSCWIILPDVLTSFLKRYNLPCVFEDIRKHCRNTSQDLLPVEKRVPHQQTMVTHGVALQQSRQNDGFSNGVSQMNGIQQQQQQLLLQQLQQQQQQQRSGSFNWG